MKNIVTDNLNQIFDVESELVDDNKPSIVREERTDLPDDIAKDYTYARENLYDVIEKGSSALDELVHLAKASEHPRAFEVVSQLTKTLVDANKDLLEIQKKVKSLRKEDEQKGPNSVTNALFVGSTSELQKLIKGDVEDV
jgi:predicted house-cleaning noncanonical NTP pyrophosphatase (MazG superfamily)